MFVERRIDTRALDGLRGIAMLHVIVGHFIGSGCPSVEMTLFYLLSGYSLTLAYGVRRNTDGFSPLTDFWPPCLPPPPTHTHWALEHC